MSRTEIDLGALLRGLRRRADLSQRELAERSGVPASTVGRIESGTAYNPRFRTMERLVAAAGGEITTECGRAAQPVPHDDPAEELMDEAGRHYPAHLDVRRVVEAKDWWGAWWANWYRLPRHRWPRQAPDHTFDLDRHRRDQRRGLARGRAAAARLRVERVEVGDAPPNVWRWAARDQTGEVVGWLGAFIRSRRFDGVQEFVVADVEVAPAWRGFGLGRRLIDALRAAMPEAGVMRARVLVDESDIPHQFFRACGFIMHGPQPSWLMLLPPRPG